MKNSDIVREFSLPRKLTHGVIVDILANGLFAGYCGFDGVDFDQAAYQAAKEKLIAEGMEGPTVEDIQARMLEDGGSISLHTLEGDDDEWNELTLDKLVKGLSIYDEKPVNGTLADILSGDKDLVLDSNDYDAVLQYAVFGDLAIG